MVNNNETLGMSCERAICEIFNQSDEIEENRVNMEKVNNLKPLLAGFFNENNITYLQYTGKNQNKTDYVDNNKKTYSVKTNNNKSEKICPQMIGQCTRQTFCEKIYYQLEKGDPYYLLDNEQIKEWILNNTHKLLVKYFENLFCCDYLLYIKELNNSYKINMYSKNSLKLKDFKKEEIVFTRTKENWNESNTVKIILKNANQTQTTLSIGEFQIHNNRNCIKFRFNWTNLCKYFI